MYSTEGQQDRCVMYRGHIVLLLAVALTVSSVLTACAGPEQAQAEEQEKALAEDTAESGKEEGNAKFDVAQLRRAIEDYDEPILLKPEYADIFYNRGNVNLTLGQSQRAIEDYDKAILLNPEHAGAYFNRGIAYRELGKKTEAVADFEKLITLTDDAQWIGRARQQIEELKE